MSRRVEICIERKIISVIDIRGEKLRIYEVSKKKGSTFVELYYEQVKWLIKWLDAAIKDLSLVGVLGAKQSGGNTLTVSICAEDNGVYMLLDLMLAQGRKRNFFVFIPAGHDRAGWVQFKDVLIAMCKPIPAKSNAKIIEQNFGGVKRVDVIQGFEDETKVLRKKGVSCWVEVENFLWDDAMKVLQTAFNLSQESQWKKINNYKTLIICVSKDEAQRLCLFDHLMVLGTKVFLCKWRPAIDTFLPSWIPSATVWVTCYGIPYHLRRVEVLEKIVAGFGRFLSAEEGSLSFHGVSGIPVLVANCDIYKIPHLMPLVDQGVYYVISLHPSVSVLAEAAFPIPSEGMDADAQRRRLFEFWASQNWI